MTMAISMANVCLHCDVHRRSSPAPHRSGRNLVSLLWARNTARWWRHHAENQGQLRRGKSVWADGVVRALHTRCILQLWRRHTVVAVGVNRRRQTERVLDIVRWWQRRYWEHWVASFRHRSLANRFLRYWSDVVDGSPGMVGSDDEPVRRQVTSSSESESSSDDPEWFYNYLSIRFVEHAEW